MTPGALYLRVSKDDGSQSVDNQRPALEQMAAARGYEIGERVYIDNASGAKTKEERPGLLALMGDAARGKFRAVLVWALDRFSRDGTFLGGLMMVGELDRYRVALLSYQETYIDTAGPFREPLVALAMKIAQQERARLRERTMAGQARARLLGKHIGRPVVDVKPAAIVRAYALRLKGQGWRMCAATVRQEGLGDYDAMTLRRRVAEALKSGALAGPSEAA